MENYVNRKSLKFEKISEPCSEGDKLLDQVSSSNIMVTRLNKTEMSLKDDYPAVLVVDDENLNIMVV